MRYQNGGRTRVTEALCVVGLCVLVGTTVVGGVAAGYGPSMATGDGDAGTDAATAEGNGSGARAVAQTNETRVDVSVSADAGEGSATVQHDAFDPGFERGVSTGTCAIGLLSGGPVAVEVDGETGSARVNFSEGGDREVVQTDAQGIVDACSPA
jgi:hypothetical protein